MTSDENRAVRDALSTCVKDNLAEFAFSLKTDETARAICGRLEQALSGLAPIVVVRSVSCRFEAGRTVIELRYVTRDRVVRTLAIARDDA